MPAVYPTPEQLNAIQAAIANLYVASQSLTIQGNAPNSVSTLNASLVNLQSLATSWMEGQVG